MIWACMHNLPVRWGLNPLGVSEIACGGQRFSGATCMRTGKAHACSVRCVRFGMEIEKRNYLDFIDRCDCKSLHEEQYLRLDCKRWWNLLAKQRRKTWWFYAQMGTGGTLMLDPRPTVGHLQIFKFFFLKKKKNCSILDIFALSVEILQKILTVG
jgi:hypothetical protein